MLILATISIYIAIQGGLIDKAKTASNKTQYEADREELLSAVVGTYDSITKENLEKALGDNWDVKENEDDTFTCTKIKTRNSYIVDKNGNITKASSNKESSETPQEGSVSPDLEKYILGQSKTGRDLYEIINDDEGNIEFVADPEDTNSSVYQDVKFGYMDIKVNDDEVNVDYYIRYGKDVYKIETEILEDTGDEVTKKISLINSPSGHLGDYVTYGGKQYIVMSENSNTVDLISAYSESALELGRDDLGAIAAVPAVDNNNITEEERVERAIWSYNNAMETIVKACKQATNLNVDGENVLSIRSVGNTNIKYTSDGITVTDNPGAFSSSYNWYAQKGYNIKRTDTNFSSDYTKLINLGILALDNDNRIYWIASRCIFDDTDYRVVGGIRTFEGVTISSILDNYNEEGCMYFFELLENKIESMSAKTKDNNDNPICPVVRPIVTVSAQDPNLPWN